METGNPLHRPLGRRRAGILVLSGFVLAGCGSAGAEGLGLTRTGAPVRLGVAAVDVINAYTPAAGGQHIGHLLPRSPAERLEEWAESRLIPGDNRGNLLVTITRASLTEEALDSSGGFSSFFTNEQSRLVRVEFEGVFQFSHPEGGRSMTITVRTAHEHSIAESASTSEADEIRTGVVTEGLARLDQEFRRQLRESSQSGWPGSGG